MVIEKQGFFSKCDTNFSNTRPSACESMSKESISNGRKEKVD